MSDNNASGRRRSGSHFATSDKKQSINWGFSDDDDLDYFVTKQSSREKHSSRLDSEWAARSTAEQPSRSTSEWAACSTAEQPSRSTSEFAHRSSSKQPSGTTSRHSSRVSTSYSGTSRQGAHADNRQGAHTLRSAHNGSSYETYGRDTAYDTFSSRDTAGPQNVLTQSVPTSSTNSFQTISASQGARVTTRDTAREDSEAARRSFNQKAHSVRLTGTNRPQIQSRSRGGSPARVAVAVVIVGLAIVGSLFLAQHFLANIQGDEDEQTAVQQAVVAPSETISFSGYSYTLVQQDDGAYAFVRSASGESLTIATLAGDPVALILDNGIFYMPENMTSGWDILCYMPGDGSVASEYVGEDGNPLTGTEVITDAELTEDAILLTDSSGATISVAFA